MTPSPARPISFACAGALLAVSTLPAWAQESPQDTPAAPAKPAEAAPTDATSSATPTHFVAGLLVSSGPKYAGGEGRSTSLRPAWAIEHGRFRLSTARGSAIMGHGLATVDIGSGVSAALIDEDRWRLRASLLVDNGRDEGDGPRLVGLPKVRATLRARLGLGYAITPRWGLGLSVAQDILGRSGGSQWSASMGYTMHITQQTSLNLGVGASWGDQTYMRTHYSVPASAAPRSPLPAFAADAGLYSIDAGMDAMTALTRSWVLFGGLHVAQLQGDARRSPITVRPTSFSASIGLAYRCCR
ncbi:MipA/OmpV family protein [Extensimonas sp. H3M7-6]|uniref:MipA/OmpV family protein n=1 Tax=Extensimonas soli TaxID=3031322 RepID=UPI0023D9EA6A|nr:MipA/OmpV family protein [Extensimonas sp. H3M7-6]MDF1480730.1 MipA/OmpV family protein [Extensimonas sp. H3M7-6]